MLHVIFGIVLVLIPQLVSACDSESKVRENTKARFKWSCDAGLVQDVRAFWDIEFASNSSCFIGTTAQEFKIEARWAKTVTEWCHNNVGGDGFCNINASAEVIPNDPCPETTDYYLRVCMTCKSNITYIYFGAQLSMQPDFLKGFDKEVGRNFMANSVKDEVEPVLAKFTGSFGAKIGSVESFFNRKHIMILLYLSGQADISAVSMVYQALNVTLSRMDLPFFDTVLGLYGYRIRYKDGLCTLYNAFNLCINGGRCVATDGVPTCICEFPFGGEYCESLNCSQVTNLYELFQNGSYGSFCLQFEAFREKCITSLTKEQKKLLHSFQHIAQQTCAIRG